MSESTSHHDNLRDQIGQALNDAIASGAPQADYCDSREVDRLADAVLPLVAHLERQRANLLRRQGETFDQMAARRRARIDAAQARGESPPRDPAPGCGGYFDPLWLDADDDSPLPLPVTGATLAAQAPVQGDSKSMEFGGIKTPVQGDAQAVPGLIDALKFYAAGSHFQLHDPSAWDTVSGEPCNFYEDESNTATVEDGSVAKAALTAAGVQ